jgi:cell shape-determining protein MreC
LIAAQKLLHNKVAQYFQKHFSKHIRVTDIPRGDDLNRVDPRTLRENLKRQIEEEHRECILMEMHDYDIADTVVYGDMVSTDGLEGLDIGVVVRSDDNEDHCSLEDVAEVKTAVAALKMPFAPAAGIHMCINRFNFGILYVDI